MINKSQLSPIFSGLNLIMENSRKRKLETLPINNFNTTSTNGASDLVGEHEVFLSFCGKDTRLGFTDFLYIYLSDAGIRTFRDSEGLHIGEEIGSDLIQAINTSKISIPIFSKNYASRKWCLRELAQMVECHKNGKHKIFPIFLDVHPSEVQHQTGYYGEAFSDHHKNNVDEDTTKIWKNALGMVGDFKGLELEKETNGRQGELAKKIVEYVLLELKKNYTSEPDNLVGMDHHIEAMNDLLHVGFCGTRIVGIHGLGGLGKTTIAKVIYNRLCDDFKACCFLDDVRANSERLNGLLDLQKQLLSKMQKSVVGNIASINEGINRIKNAVGVKKVLIVLDDVDDKYQVDMLVGKCSWFGAGSKIIITTRNKEVLDALEATYQSENLHDVYGSYEPEFMNHSHSRRLFSKCAFMMDSPPEYYDRLVTEFASAAGGLPLVLVTIGSSLLGKKDIDLWEEKLQRLKEIPHKLVLGKLRISFDALEYGQQQIFLDIACFFIGCDLINTCYMWDACRFYPRDGLNALELRHMVKMDDKNKLWMHDQLRDLGRQIVREQNMKRSRLWNDEDTMDLLEGRVAATNVEALDVLLPEDHYQSLVGEDVGRLLNLRFLRSGAVVLDENLMQHLSKLRWLVWACPENVLLINCRLRNLVILDLSSSRVTHDWKGWSEIQMAKGLKVITLKECLGLRRSPVFSEYKSLQRLSLSSCSNLEEIDPSIQVLTNLRVLDLSLCRIITRLNCSTFSALEDLTLKQCDNLCSLDGLEQLRSLRSLDMSGCRSLKGILDVSKLKKLKILDVYMCINITEFQGLDKLESVELLCMSDCESLELLADLSNLVKLKILRLHGCVKLLEVKGLGVLESLECLDLSRCNSLKEFPDLSNFKILKDLTIQGVDHLTEIRGLEELKSLETLDICECNQIDKLPDLSAFQRLREIDFSGCQKLTEIQGLEELRFLESLDIQQCRLIDKLPDLSVLQNLRELYACECEKLTEIRGLEELISLEFLTISGCKLIKELPDLSNLRNLRELHVCGCNLTEIRGIEELRYLEALDIQECRLIEKLPDLSALENLIEIFACECEKLTEIRGLEKLISLEQLNISGCKLINELPDLANLQKLREILVSGCKLTEIRGLEELKSLERLEIDKSFENIPSLANTTIEHNPEYECSSPESLLDEPQSEDGPET